MNRNIKQLFFSRGWGCVHSVGIMATHLRASTVLVIGGRGRGPERGQLYSVRIMDTHLRAFKQP